MTNRHLAKGNVNRREVFLFTLIVVTYFVRLMNCTLVNDVSCSNGA